MKYCLKKARLSALFSVVLLSGCLESFPVYQPLIETQVDMLSPDAALTPDQGRLCGSDTPAALGMPCELVGGEVCGVWSCVDAPQSDTVNLSCLMVPEDGTPIPVPQEQCNGVDDNCNGEIDEDFPLVGSECPMERLVNGQMTLGTLICNPSRDIGDADQTNLYVCDCCLPNDAECNGTPCVFEQNCVNSGPEVCNNEDDDCDTRIDEDLDIPCSYQLDRCNVAGVDACVGGMRTNCLPPAVLPSDCRCLDASFAGGGHYLHCPSMLTWSESRALCSQIQSSTGQGVAGFPTGQLLEIESEVEQNAVVNKLYQQGNRAAKTWLNHRYDPTTDPTDFDDWLAQYFPMGSYHRIEDNDFESDEERCLTLEEFPDYDWNFDPCVLDVNTVTCEFCADPMLDQDGDGHFACADDCDDMDDEVHWDAAELCYNGKDDNCNGLIDEECACELRVYNGHQYVFCFDASQVDLLNWEDARTQCRDWNMDLLVVDDMTEFNQIAGLANVFASRELFWLGVRQPTRGLDNESDEADRARAWRWVQSGVTDDPSSRWWQDEDRNRHDRPDRDCGRLFPQSGDNSHIRPDKCRDELHYICESL